MKKIQKVLTWYYMLSKRLLLKWSFIILICLIPVAVPVMNNILAEDSSVLKIMLCCEDDDVLSKNIIDTLMDGDGIIKYSFCNSAEEAKKSVETYQTDAAWILKNNLTERAIDYVSKEDDDALVEVIERESNVPLRLSKEMLCGAVYRNISYYIYRDFVYSEVIGEDEFTETKLKEYYEEMENDGDIVKIRRLNSQETSSADSNYLVAPLRGILSLMIVLCTLAAVLYFLQDQLEGKYAWMRPQRRIIPAFAMCLSAAVFSAVAVLAALYFGNIFTNLYTELTAIILFVIATTGFALVLSRLFKSPGKFGAIIPGILIIMLVLSPIFINLKILKPIRMMLPTHYYLNVIYNSDYYLSMIIYCAAVYAAAFLLNLIKTKEDEAELLS